VFLFSSRRRHTISKRDWSSVVCSSDLAARCVGRLPNPRHLRVSEKMCSSPTYSAPSRVQRWWLYGDRFVTHKGTTSHWRRFTPPIDRVLVGGCPLARESRARVHGTLGSTRHHWARGGTVQDGWFAHGRAEGVNGVGSHSTAWRIRS